MNDVRHLKVRYYLPSWQGGDVIVARCMKGATGYSTVAGTSIRLTDEPMRVDCERCRRIMAGLPFNVIPEPVRRAA